MHGFWKNTECLSESLPVFIDVPKIPPDLFIGRIAVSKTYSNVKRLVSYHMENCFGSQEDADRAYRLLAKEF